MFSKDLNKTIDQFPSHLKMLKDKGLIIGDKFPYQITYIGKLIKEYCETNSFYSQKSTLSHIVEYKIFEFFSDKFNSSSLDLHYQISQ